MAFNKLENEIIELADNKKINIKKVEELFKLGADPNALEEDEPERDWDNYMYWSTLFSECILYSQRKETNLYQLLELFIKYGLDTNKYGASIISDLHFISENSDIYEMTKLLLDNMDRNTDVNVALSGIGTEESYLNCSFDDMDYESNNLFGLYELIDAFAHNKPYKSFYKLPKKINEKFIKLSIKGDYVALTKNKVTVKKKKRECSMISKIEMEKNTLIIEDNFAVYINNEDQNKYKDNSFTEYANEYFKNEKIINLKFKHYKIKIGPITHIRGRVVTINFTNNKKLVYGEDYDNQLETLEIV